MRAGVLDTRITLQRKTVSPDNAGEPVETWSDLATRWASMIPLTGTERLAGEHLVAQSQVQFRVRWTEDIADLSPLDRVVVDGEVYNIIQALVVGRNVMFQILAVHFVNS